jgi:RNA polymerase sigma factor for flagellar operon FliA
MKSRQELEALFLANLPAAEKILSALARRNALSGDAAEEFAAWAKLRLIENDYAILGKFRGESSLPTYLTVVLSMLFREYRVQQWGRWRPSAVARRSGDIAVRLETLTLRDGLSVAEAGEVLRTSGMTQMSDGELAKLAVQFPIRTPLRPVQVGETPVEPAGPLRADDLVENQEEVAESVAVHHALDGALRTLTDEDRLIVRLHYLESMSVADISRALAVPAKPLYRRLERALIKLRAGLERAGVSRDRVRLVASEPR